MAVIDAHRGNEIRKQLALCATHEEQYAVLKSIKDAIIDVLAAYTGASAEATYSNVVPECVALITHKFSDFTIADIKEAYRMLAANQTTADYKSYGGVATVTAFGSVMSAYKELKDAYLSKIEKEKRQAEVEEEERKRAEDKEQKEQYEKTVIAWYHKNLKSKGTEITVDRIPWYYYTTLEELGYVNPDESSRQKCLRESAEVIKNKVSQKTTREPFEMKMLYDVRDLGLSTAMSNADHRIKTELIQLAKKIYLYRHFISGGQFV